MSEVNIDIEKVANAVVDKYKGSLNGLENRMLDLEQLGAGHVEPGIRGNSKAAYTAFNKFLHGDEMELKQMSIVGGASAGEALVPEVIANDILQRALAQSELASIVRNTRSGTSDYVRLLNLRGQVAAWSGETDTRNDTATLQLREIRPTHGELYSVVPVTRWLAQDSQFDVSEMVLVNATEQFAKSIEAAVMTGDGANKPTGILNSTPTIADDDSSPQRGADVIEAVVSGGDLADDIITLFFTLKNEYRKNASFVMNSAQLATVRKLRDANGSGFLWQPSLSNEVDAPNGGFLLGRPVYTSEEITGVTGNSPQQDAILCGDFYHGYELVTHQIMDVVRDDVTTKGIVKVYISFRIGGRITDNNAIKVLRG